MIRKIVISSFLFFCALAADAQDALIKVWADQQVFISGEDLWVDGILQNAKAVSKTMHLQLLDRNGNRKAAAEVMLSGNEFSANLTIPENLPSDYYFLDAYSNGMKCTTALFPVMIVNPKIPPSLGCSFTGKNAPAAATGVTVFPDKESYHPRNEVKLSVNGLTAFQQTHLSVVKYDQLNTIYEQAAAGFNAVAEHMEVSEKEEEGNVVVATVRKAGKSVSGITALAALKGNTATLAIAKSDEAGRLKFLFPFKYDVSQVVLHPLNNEKDISFEMSSSASSLIIHFPCLKIDEKCREDIETRMLNLNITRNFYADLNRVTLDKKVDTTDFYGKPDARYYLDEYVRFPNMEEVIAEIIPEVRVKKEKDKSVLNVLNIPFKFFFNEEGLILVDGIPYFNTKELLESDPLLIKSIDVINRKYIMGDHEFDGIIHFKTYRNDMGSLRLSEADKSFPLKGLQKNTGLKPAFAVGNTTRLPDMRNLVYKKNSIASDFRGSATLGFTLSDAIGNYAIIIRGIDKQGNSTVSSKNFNVVK